MYVFRGERRQSDQRQLERKADRIVLHAGLRVAETKLAAAPAKAGGLEGGAASINIIIQHDIV